MGSRMINVGTFYGARRWDDEESSQRAFDAALAETDFCSVWRIRSPLHPPHRDYVVIVMGEDAKRVDRHLERLDAFDGKQWMGLEPDLVEALRKRRLSQALDNVRSGDNSVKVSRGKAHTIDQSGRMTPLEESNDA
jgi:hypothetical protein